MDLSRRAERLILAVLLGALGAAVAAGPASAYTPAPPATVEFEAGASNGYSVQVEGSPGSLTLSVERGGEGAVYATHGRVSPTSVVARFGHLGRIDVRFERFGKTHLERPERGCKGKPRTFTPGFFVGTIRFAGERGYTRLRLSRAFGRTETRERWTCRGASGGPGRQPAIPDLSGVGLEATDRRAGIAFSASRISLPSLKREIASCAVVLAERREGQRILRWAIDLDDEGALIADEALANASVAPARPFSGTATFVRNPSGPPSWTGSLAVKLPGGGRLPLTGPRFFVRLASLRDLAAAS